MDEYVEAFKNQTGLLCEQTFCGTTLFGTLPLPAPLGESVCRYEVLFSKKSPQKIFKFYLEHLLLTCQTGQEKTVTGKLVFAREEENAKLYFFPPVHDAAEKLENFMKTALSTYSSPRPLPIFAAASYEYCKRSLAKNPKTPPEKDPAVRKKFLESDLQYHKVIGEFFDEDNFNDEEFRELAKFLFSDIAQIKPGEL
jgi:hypothetical protein